MRTQLIIILSLSMAITLGAVHSAHSANTPAPSSAVFNWSRVSLASGSQVPPARNSPAMVYDPLDGYMLLYGGWNNVSNYLGDTWIFTQNSWTQLNPATSPGPRSDASISYDPADGYVLLYGGDSGSGQTNDTWAFKAGQWTRIGATVSPSPRQDPSMVFDSADGHVLLFGGVNTATTPNYHYYNDTWAFKSGHWTQLSTALAPAQRGSQGTVYDPAEGYTLLFGGSTDYWSVNGGQSDTWTYTHGTWSHINPSGSPDHRYSFGLVWDPAIAGDLFYGGWDPAGACGNEQNDTRIYRDESWRMLTPQNTPGERQAFGMDYDPVLGSVILFGGQGNVGAGPTSGCGTPYFLNDTWQYSLTSTPLTTPGPTPLPGVSYLTSGMVGALIAAGAGTGAYMWKRQSNGRKVSLVGSAKPALVCTACGTSLPIGSAYCGKCGKQLTA